MMKVNQFNFKKVCLISGIVLIILSLITLAFWQGAAYKNSERNQNYINTLYELIPEPQSAAIESRTNNAMPSLNVGGQNFVAIMELPVNSASFPIGASWSNNRDYPCIYTGSVYDGTLVVGTSNQKGQLEFVKEISVGNTIYITDMTGKRYSFEVCNIQYQKHADNDSLLDGESDLTLFVKNIYAFEYIIIHCNA